MSEMRWVVSSGTGERFFPIEGEAKEAREVLEWRRRVGITFFLPFCIDKLDVKNNTSNITTRRACGLLVSFWADDLPQEERIQALGAFFDDYLPE